MTKARPKTDILPRVLSFRGTAHYIGKSETYLHDHRAELEAMGFPIELPVLGGYDKEAIDAWFDHIGGHAMANDGSFDDRLMEASKCA